MAIDRIVLAAAGFMVSTSLVFAQLFNRFRMQAPDGAGVIVCTGVSLAALIGAFFILDDPIFSGLAVSLLLVSTLLTLVVIPVLYCAYLRRRRASQGV